MTAVTSKTGAVPMAAPIFKIEKGVPMPRNGAGGRTKYPWDKMEVGDSFFVPGTRNRGVNPGAASLRLSPKKFAMRKVDGGTRIWRIA